MRLTVLFAASILTLTACAADTTEPASTSGRGGTGGTVMNTGGPRGAPGSQEDLARSAGDRILFDTDQSVVTDPAREILDRQAQWLRQNPRIAVWVAGNSDERGTEEYNLALSQRRAIAARDYLMSRGIGSGRIQTIGFGKSRPVDPSPNQDGWALNRNAITSVR